MKTRITIGRHSDNDIVVDAKYSTVSGRHATITRSGNSYIFEDHSTNGSYINEQKVHNTTVTLRHGDTIRLSTSYALGWRQIDALMADERATIDNRATQMMPQSEPEPVRRERKVVKEPIAEYRNAEPSSNNYNSKPANEPKVEKPEPPKKYKPKCLNDFNWGAFMMPGIWGLFNSHWWLLLVMIGIGSIDKLFDDAMWATIVSLVLELIVGFIFGVSGNESAWDEEKTTLSLEEANQFDKKQKRWNVAGIIVAIPFGIMLFMLICEYI